MTPRKSSALLDHYGSPIAKFLRDDDVNEVCVNSFEEIWIERKGVLVKTDACFKSEKDLAEFVRQIAHSLNQEVHEIRNPVLDARLPDGTRINAVLPPVAIGGTTVNLRPFRQQPFTYEDLIASGSIPSELTPILREVFHRGDNVVVSGATGSGKTTFLRTLTRFFEPGERVVVIEDTNENIVPHHDHVVSFEAPRRTSSSDIGAEMSMGRLIRNSLRQRPDRIVVGEIRTPEAASAYLEATNTGHTGCLSTTHANSPDDAIRRIANLKAETLPGSDFERITREVQSNTHVIVHVAKFKEDAVSTRRIASVNFYTVSESKNICYYDSIKRQFNLSEDQ